MSLENNSTESSVKHLTEQLLYIERQLKLRLRVKSGLSSLSRKMKET